MAIIDIFKKKKKPAAGKPERPAEKAEAASAEARVPKRERRIFGVIIAPHLTEKTSGGAAQGWYTFRVGLNADKLSVKRAVEDRYGVRVLRVRMSHERPRTIRLGRREGQVPGFKKAMVKVAAGQSLEFGV